MLIGLCIVYGYFCATITELSSCDRDCTVSKAYYSTVQACQPEMSHYAPEWNIALLISTTINKYLLSEQSIISGLGDFLSLLGL